MSFDIVLQPCSLSDRMKTVKHPATGKSIKVPDDQLTASEVAAVNDLLQRTKATVEGEFRCHSVRFRDKGSLELFMDGLDGSEPCEGCMACLRGYTPQTIEFLHELSRVGNLMLMPIDGEDLEIVTSDSQRKQVHARHPDVLIAGTPGALGVLLEKGVEAWEAYRDRVVPGRRGAPKK
jgi:hypothetical protein